MAFEPPTLWYDVLGGYNAQPEEGLRQDRRLIEQVTAQNVIQDPPYKLVTSPGFSQVRSTALAGSTAVTGMATMADLASEFILSGADGTFYRDNANPPGAIAGGTNFASGANVLTRFAIANNILLAVSSSRNLPQTFTSGVARADLTADSGGTVARGIDVKPFARRIFMFSPSDGTTTYRSFASFTSAVDSNTAWLNPFTTNFLNFGVTGGKVNLLGGELYGDRLMAFTADRVYGIYQTPNALLPVAFQDALFAEEGGGPPVIHAVVAANQRLYWISQNYDVKELAGGEVLSRGFPIQPFLRGLQDARRVYTVGGWEPRYRMVVWSVTNAAAATAHDRLICYQVDSKQFTIITRARNAFANRIVSGQQRLIGGGYAGFFYNEFDSATTGDADSATTAIDATITLPRMHLGLPGVLKKVPYVCVEFSPVGSESITVRSAVDDGQTYTAFDESPAVITGTTIQRKFFRITQQFERLSLQFEDAIANDRYRVIRVGFPRPRIMRALVS